LKIVGNSVVNGKFCRKFSHTWGLINEPLYCTIY